MPPSSRGCGDDPGPVRWTGARENCPPVLICYRDDGEKGERTMPDRPVVYASVGADLIHFDVDTAAATLTRRATVTVPANVQYAWPHASRRFLYVASSDSASGMGPAGKRHHVSAFRIDPASGALSHHGAPISLPHRPIHMATDIPSQHVLVAFNNPPSVGVWRINADRSEEHTSDLQSPSFISYAVF